MSESIVTENSPLYLRAKQAILDLIMGALSQGSLEDNKLPSEEELCQRLGVSRPTVREALMALSREGIITKRHGTGNLVHPSALEPRLRFDTHTDFLVMLRGKGYEAELQCGPLRPATPEEEAALTACGGKGPCRFFQERKYMANGLPAILCYSYLRVVPHLRVAEAAQGAMRFADLLRRVCGEEPSHAMSRIQPAVANAAVGEFFHVDEGRPVLRLLEGHYGIHDTLLAQSVVYLNPNMLDLSILRKW